MMVERILYLIKIKKLTPSQFADEIGIQRSGMSHIISGRNKPSLEFVLKILKRYPEVKPEWLLYGSTNPEINTDAGAAMDMNPEQDKQTDKAVLTNVPASLFDEMEAADLKPETKPQRSQKKDKADRKIEKIVVFYDDRTFREYDPEK